MDLHRLPQNPYLGVTGFGEVSGRFGGGGWLLHRRPVSAVPAWGTIRTSAMSSATHRMTGPGADISYRRALALRRLVSTVVRASGLALCVCVCFIYALQGGRRTFREQPIRRLVTDVGASLPLLRLLSTVCCKCCHFKHSLAGQACPL